MSRIGKLPINLEGTTVTYEKNLLTVKGPKGELSLSPHPKMKISINENDIVVERPNEEKKSKSLHGLTRTLVANMIEGVTKGFEKRLEIQGVGYRAQVQGKKITLSLGYSHPIEYLAPEGITLAMDEEKKNIIIISGIDKQKVGQVASEIRGYRKPEPYKGKGIRYIDEYVRRKAGKTAAKAES